MENNKHKRINANAGEAKNTDPVSSDKKFVTEAEKAKLQELKSKELEYAKSSQELGEIVSEIKELEDRREQLINKIVPESKKDWLKYRDKLMSELGDKYGAVTVLDSGEIAAPN